MLINKSYNTKFQFIVILIYGEIIQGDSLVRIFKNFKKQKSNEEVIYNKEIFINNVKYINSYGVDEEISLFDKNGDEYFIIACKDFVEFYDKDDNYLKLNNIDDLFEFINIDDIVEISGAIDYSKDVKDNQS